jgi:PII-like signaling protein
MTVVPGKALRITVFGGESDQFHHRPLYTEIVHRAHAAGLAGASVFRGSEGYGESNRIHTTRLLSLSGDLPMMILIVDTPEKVAHFLPELSSLVTQGLILVDEVNVVHHVIRGEHPDGKGARPVTSADQHQRDQGSE